MTSKEKGKNAHKKKIEGTAPFMATTSAGFLHTRGSKWGCALALHRALRRMAGLVFLLVFWVLAGACQRHGVGGCSLRNTTTTKWGWGCARAPSTCDSSMAGCPPPPPVLAGACQFGTAWAGLRLNSFIQMGIRPGSCACGPVLRLSRLWVRLVGLWAYAKRNFPGRASCGPFSKILM